MNKHFLLGAGFALIITFASSSVFAQSLAVLSPNSMIRCNALGRMATSTECSAADASATPADKVAKEKSNLEKGIEGGALQPGQMISCISAGTKQVTVEACIKAASDMIAGGDYSSLQQQSAQQILQPTVQPSISQPVQQITTPAQSDNGISDLKKILEEMKAEQEKQKQEQEKEDLMKMLKEVTQQNKQPSFEDQQLEEEGAPVLQQQNNKVSKPKLSSAKNPSVALAKKGLQNVNKLLNTLSKKFKKEKNKNKKLAVVRSVAKDFMKLCTKYAPSIQDEEFGDEESFTCDEFVAEISEPIASALKSKDADLAYEATYDALDINFRELFDSLTQQ